MNTAITAFRYHVCLSSALTPHSILLCGHCAESRTHTVLEYDVLNPTFKRKNILLYFIWTISSVLLLYYANYVLMLIMIILLSSNFRMIYEKYTLFRQSISNTSMKQGSTLILNHIRTSLKSRIHSQRC